MVTGEMNPFDALADALAERVSEFYSDQAEWLATPAGDNTLRTNSSLVESRAMSLLSAYFEASGRTDLQGTSVLDVGCGFGAMSVYLASRGATVTAVDPNQARFEVGGAVARDAGLAIDFRRGWVEELRVPVNAYDLAILNNSLCYVLPRLDRLIGLRLVRGSLRRGGWLAMRNPNRWHPRDAFTGLPLVGMLGPGQAGWVMKRLGRHRSEVRLVGPRAARRELRKAGFVSVRSVGDVPGPLGVVARYQHLVGQRPA